VSKDGAFEDAINIRCRGAYLLFDIDPIAHQPPVIDKAAICIDCR